METKISIYGPQITYQYCDEGELDCSTGGGCTIEIPTASITCAEDIRGGWQTDFFRRWANSNRGAERVFARLQERMRSQLQRLPDNPFVQRAAYLAGVTDDPGEYVLGWVSLAKTLAAEDAEELKSNQEKQKEIEESKRGISCIIIKRVKGHGGEDGVDPSALVEIIIDGGAPLRFNCRNIFDFGYVINPDFEIALGLGNGGLYNRGMWQDFKKDRGWYDVREATPEEKRALDYLYLNPPINDGIRM
jgi:hypothetical protein